MRVRIAKTFDFDAAHFLPMVPASHKCHRMHGHTYRVEVSLEGEPDERGMVADYAEIAAAWDAIYSAIDHRTLNDVPGLENPTTECLAPWILERFRAALPQTVAVRVYESSTTYCESLSAPPGFPVARMTDARLQYWETAYPGAGELFAEVHRARANERLPMGGA